MLIILEGCDGTGKSTLAAALFAALDRRGYATLIHRGPPERHPLEEYVLDLDGYRPGGDQHVVADRWHWGEAIYGPLYRAGSTLSEGQLRYVDLYLASRGALMIHTDPSDVSAYRDRLAARGEDFLQSHHVDHVLAAFRDRAAQPSPLQRLTVDPLEFEPERLADLVLIPAFANEVAASPLAAEPRYLGTPMPSALLVGEERSPRQIRGERPDYMTPFVPYADSCARYLWDAVPLEATMDVGVVNALEVEDLEALWRRLGEPRVVALGGVAADRLTLAGVPHAATTHPQYARRFQHGRLDEYGRHLADLIQGGDSTWSTSV